VSNKTIVLADDDVDLVDFLTERCTAQGYAVIGVNSALEAINVIHRVVPDLVCIDVNMPAGNGLSVCEMMANDERLRSIPVVVLTGEPSEKTIRRCHDMMIYYVEKNVDVWSRVEPLFAELLGAAVQPRTFSSDPPRPANAGASFGRDKPTGTRAFAADDRRSPAAAESASDALLDAVFAMLGSESDDVRETAPEGTPSATQPQTDGEPPWVLSIDDDADFSDALKCRLEAYGVAVVRAFSGMEGYRLAFTSPASAILLDYNMPDGQGDYILGRLSDNPVTRNIPVIMITGVRDKSLERKVYGLGAKCFLTKPVKFETLRDELAKYIEILSVPA
jgi:CheY-like chemotaxis protein